MPAERASNLRLQLFAVLILVAGLLVTWFAYAPALGGSLHFDDRVNLGGLARVTDSASAIRFIATGISGPLGRPIALASFVPQAYAWPGAVGEFLYTNILIHVLNGALVAWLLYLLGLARKRPEHEAALIAAGAAGIWMLLPMLASSSLLVVQRMTTLSATFVLLGGIAYLYARRGVERRPIASLLCMTFAIGIGTVLATLAKENGILFFAFVLAAEATLLKRPLNVPRTLWRGWFSLVLIAPLVMLLIYLASILPYSEGIIARRGFNGFERLITQAEILWKYLYLAFVPSIPNLGPFQDDYPAQRSLFSPTALLAVVAWLIAIIAAVVFRRKAPLFSFAVAWYLLGHLLESTTVSLELYFEHRNYLPLVGPVYALIASLPQLDAPWRRMATFGASAYAAVLATLLFSTASLWGSPALAAEMWQIYKPDSLRATQYLARTHFGHGDRLASRRVLNRYLEANPDAHDVRLQVLVTSCRLDADVDHGAELQDLVEKFEYTKFTHSSITAYQQLYELVREDECKGIDDEAVYRLGQAMLANPGYIVPVARHNIHAVLARIGIERRDFGLTMMHMESALASHHNPDTLLLAIGILNSGGRLDISRELLDDAMHRPAPRNPLRARQWRNELERIDAALLAMEQRSRQ